MGNGESKGEPRIDGLHKLMFSSGPLSTHCSWVKRQMSESPDGTARLVSAFTPITPSATQATQVFVTPVAESGTRLVYPTTPTPRQPESSRQLFYGSPCPSQFTRETIVGELQMLYNYYVDDPNTYPGAGPLLQHLILSAKRL